MTQARSVPPFSHLDRGTDEREWHQCGLGALPTLQERSEAVLLGPETRLVVAAAHPDDECLGAAGLISMALASGSAVDVLLCTDGEASHPSSPTHSAAQLAEVRLGELRTALEHLAKAAHASDQLADRPRGRLHSTALHLADGTLRERSSEIRAAIDALICAPGAERVLLASPYRRDGHSDHDALGSCAAAAAAQAMVPLLEFPIWFWHWARPATHPEWRHWRRLAVPSWAREAKGRAIAAHASQTAELSPAAGDEPVVSPRMLEHFSRPFEVFRVTDAGTHDASSASERFDAVHSGHRDPWRVRASWYERRKRALMLASLPRERFARALEVGCSIGENTLALAARCTGLLSVDASDTAILAAQQRFAAQPHVELRRATMPHDWNELGIEDGTLELAVLSETGYYLAEDELCALIGRLRSALTADGVLLLSHWRGPIHGWPLDGDRVHQLVDSLGMRRLSSIEEAETRIDVFENGCMDDARRCFAAPESTARPPAPNLGPGSTAWGADGRG